MRVRPWTLFSSVLNFLGKYLRVELPGGREKKYCTFRRNYPRVFSRWFIISCPHQQRVRVWFTFLATLIVASFLNFSHSGGCVGASYCVSIIIIIIILNHKKRVF